MRTESAAPSGRRAASTVSANGVALAVECHGLPSADAVLLIAGLSMQLIDWPQALLDRLARDFSVVTFDNRDAGLSQAFGPPREPSLTEADFLALDGAAPPPPYTLFDMAADVVGLLDALAIDRAHLVGFSMGGMIAQIVAALHPQRVLSLSSLMSSGGHAWIAANPPGRAALARTILALPEAEAVARLSEDAAIYAGPVFPPIRAESAAQARRAVARAYRPAGVWRQALAMRASGDRRALIARITAPTLILHGTHDPCIALSQAEEAARLIPESRLVVIDGLGHDFPAPLIEAMAGLIADHCKRQSRRHRHAGVDSPSPAPGARLG